MGRKARWIGTALLGGLVATMTEAPVQASPLVVPGYHVTLLSGRGQLNNAGQVAGMFTPAGSTGSYAYFYDSNPGGGTTVVGVTPPRDGNPGGYDFSSHVYGMNDRGQALVGITSGKNAGEYVVVDSKTGQSTTVPLPQGYLANTIDDAGRIYGSYSGYIEASRHWGYQPFVYENGQARLINLPPGVASADLVGANDAGQVLAHAALGDGYHIRGAQAFLLSSGTWTKLGDFQPDGINDRGDVIGEKLFAASGGGSKSIFVPHGTTTPIELVSSSSGLSDTPLSVNNKGEIVGQAAQFNQGYIYRNGVTTSLHTLLEAGQGWMIRAGVSINDRGQIIALANGGGRDQYVLLTPNGLPTPPDMMLPGMPLVSDTRVPEPSTFLVFGMAAAGVLWRRSPSRSRSK